MSEFFSSIPNIYVADPSKETVPTNYVAIKNLFRRAKVVPNYFEDATFFEKYSIPQDEKPYHVAHNIYGSAKYEWVILIMNDITNVYTQWPLTNYELESKVRDLYGTAANETRYWRTIQHKNPEGKIIIEGGLIVPPNYVPKVPAGTPLPPPNMYKEPVSNYIYELELNESKRDIYLIYPALVPRFITEYQRIMQYYSSEDLVQDELQVGIKNDNLQIKVSGSESAAIRSRLIDF